MLRRNAVTRFAVAVFAALAASGASAQTYPAKPIRVIVPYAAGGSLEVIARIYAAAGIDMVHIAYKGVGPATTDLVAGHVAVMFNNIATALPFVKSGRLRALAVTGATRSPAIPESPTMGEAGYGSVDVSLWEALLAPAATPNDVIARLNSEVVKAGSAAEVQQRLTQAGIEVATSTPGELRTMVKNDTSRWAQVVKKAGLAIE